MPRRLPEKTNTINRGQGIFERAIYQSRIFLGISLSEGQEIDAVIDEVGSRGDGITREQGFLIFVPKARIGEHLRVKTVRVGGIFAIAEKITV